MRDKLFRMTQTMRWFGPKDPVNLGDIRQCGATGVVTALHEIPNGMVWPLEAIKERREMIEAYGLEWKVVESVPVHESIKQGASDADKYISNYAQTLRNLAKCGVTTVTYNFMPVIDWTRTDLHYRTEDGSFALRLEKTALAAFDLFILKRAGVEGDYDPAMISKAEKYYASMTQWDKTNLENNILAGLPGSEESFNLESFRIFLEHYRDCTEAVLRNRLIDFLTYLTPVAEQCGIRLAIHPDDPPYQILGLPRIVKNEADFDLLIKSVPSIANGICFCVGSLSESAENNLPSMILKYADRIHFVHLRNTRRNEDGFYESNHLEGSADMFNVVKNVLSVMQHRGESIPMRPDHGHFILDDVNKKCNPGYACLGRMKGLAELRGLEMGIAASLFN